VGEEVGVCGCYGFIEGDFGSGAGLDYYGAGFIAEDAITGELAIGALGSVLGTYWPAAALPKACSLEESKVLVAMVYCTESLEEYFVGVSDVQDSVFGKIV
jgi:hypothetical protein